MPACRIPRLPLRAVQQDPTGPQGLDARTVVQVNFKRIVGILVVIFILFWIISSPNSASGSVNSLLGNLREAGDSLVTFFNNVT
jgi:hypothetical protein